MTSAARPAIYLGQPGAATRVRTWTPKAGPIHGFLITHSEAISLADYYTVKKYGDVVYRPTAHYAYHPSDNAVMSIHELAGRNWRMQPRKRIMMDDVTAGMDELGVLLAGHKKNAYWYGSQLTIDEARKLAPYNNATSLQVTVAVLAGIIWAMEHPGQRPAGAGRAGPQAHPGNLPALPRHDHRRLHRLVAAVGSREPVPRGPGSHRPVAVQERAGGLRRRCGLSGSRSR